MEALLFRSMHAIRYLSIAGMMLAAANMVVSGMSDALVAGFTWCAALLVVSLWYMQHHAGPA